MGLGSRDAVKEEIRNRVGVLDVVSEYVSLKRAGKSHKGLCPFHSEKTPSFTVNEDFQTWHCFGCGEHGDVFTFLMKIENLTFPEALEKLARRAGVTLEPAQRGETSRKDVLAGINSQAASYYSDLLKKNKAALEYLHERGLADQTIEQFRLGYAAPEWDGFLQHYTKKGRQIKDAIEAGLIVSSEEGRCYDRLRHRIVFPILDIQERIIGFGGRAFGDDQPKYLNSPETPLFSKTRSLYGLNFARKSITEDEGATVVEGYMDVIAAHQSGFLNCIATLGTALTPDHIRILMRYSRKVVLAYDSDSAGMKAALRSAAMFYEADCDVKIARFPAGDDPDSILRQGKVAEFSAAISSALPIVDYRLAIVRELADLSNAAGRAAMLKQAAQIVAELPSFREREKYVRQLIDYHPNPDIGLAAVQDQIRKDVEAEVRRRGGSVVRTTSTGGSKTLAGVRVAESALLRALIQGDMAETIVSSLSPEDFSTDTGRAAAEAAFEMFREKQGIYLPELLDAVDQDAGRYLSELAIGEGPPLSEKALQDYIALIENSKVRKLKTYEVIAPYMKDGAIDPKTWPKGQAEIDDYLRKSGKRSD